MRPDTGGELLRTALRDSRPALWRIAGWSMVEALPALLYGVLVAAALDHGFLAGRPATGVAYLALLAAAMIARAAATRAMFPWFAAIVEPLRDRLVRVVVTGSLGRAVWHGEPADPSAVAGLTQHVETVRNLISALLRTSRQLAVSLIVTVVGLAALAPRALVLVLPPLAAALALFRRQLRTLAARQRAVVRADEALARGTAEVFGGIRDVVACGAQRTAAADLTHVVEEHGRASRTLAIAGGIRILVVLLGAQLPMVGVIVAAPWLTGAGGLSAGQVVGVLTYLASSLEPALRSLVTVVGTWGLQLAVTLGRLAAQQSTPPARTGRLPVPAEAALEADAVTFAYGTTEPVVQDLSLTLRRGDHLAVVGPSGIGKSTVAAMLAGVAAPQQGRITVGGVCLDDLDEAALRAHVSLVPQEAYVFRATLRENFTALRPDAGDDVLDEAVDALGMRALVDRLGGYHAELTDPDVLSAGERQLVAAARVYVHGAPVVILDEATCHLDPPAEARVEEAFAARGGTLVVIAHRISSALRADRILLLDGGRPVLGGHAELLHSAPSYADLVGHWMDVRPRTPDRSQPLRPRMATPATK
ncbi:ABC transporter ATP-binding protein [Micromonospora echinofusca]|uniref:ATP-binding cassette, subfamily C n=1 Tax=Micromonospora echinofusca TaxID=47858 RepID=A0A1C5G6X3_MICEH|nr:ABC transporter ATP-binding protein [Micromonospora echinofusca]SCG15655.1 ATP-binding cassette, subfamily C [Micromonospora echinofusca]